MKILHRVVVDIGSGKIIERVVSEYAGPLALAKGGSSGTTESKATIPQEYSALSSQTGGNIAALQRGPQAPLSPEDRTSLQNEYDQRYKASIESGQPDSQLDILNQRLNGPQDPGWIAEFAESNPTQIAPLSGTQGRSLDLLNTNLSDATKPLEESSIVQAGNRYFDTSIAPGIENSATLSGLGRSTALEAGRSAAEAQTMLPLLQQEQARRDAMIGQGFTGGDIERGVEQQGYNAEAQDMLRRQALAETALFSPLTGLPSVTGQTGSTTQSGSGGLFK